MILPPEVSPVLDCLIVDSHDQDVQILSRILGKQNYQVRTAFNGTVALKELDLKVPDIVFWDCSEQQNHDFNFDVFFDFYRTKEQNIIIFFLISFPEYGCSISLENHFYCEYIRKPFYPEEIILRVKNIWDYRQSQKVMEDSLIQLEQEVSTRQKLEYKLEQISQKLQTTTEQLTYLSRFDTLTQLANRPYFDEYLFREWQRLARERMPLSLIIGDVDGFQSYNEVYGYQQGDICLQTLAKTMIDCIKRPADLIARYSGEEFAVLLPHTSSAGAIEVAKLIRAKIKQLEIYHPKSEISSYLTLSLGVATVIPQPELPPNPLITVAEEALQEAKRQGCDRIGVGVHWR
ncbi:putative Response regulator receiver modulated diguanylate cyclase [Planktothrix serta PCC 8927]|uniref:Response regulator receiver modulated diguanylate cyclase n=1 Tax=Planktothrix serta PCC 8927 TaxID=671068 RepID=A0A7Z9C0G0_9CYAN|nr:diguanylate cyclase [Planktothrix serta]VXD23328.1 putative Response regulator receiver modulated diguanylate cyclase [Planktothrix serta PCC 8927]